MSGETLLALEQVSKSYWRGPHELRVLVDVSLEVRAGELVTVWGQRRSGKTTLLKLAAGLEEPSGGTVRFTGRDLAGLSASSLARVLRWHIGWAKPTGPESRELSMLDYVALPLLGRHGRRTANRHAATALARVGVRDCATERWVNLSDSEQALVAIAHALVRTPQLLLVDDQTANLDDLQREEVMQLLRAAAEDSGVGVLVTVPDMAEMLHAHQIRSLSSGRLLAPAEPTGDRDNVIDFPGSERRRAGRGDGASGESPP